MKYFSLFFMAFFIIELMVIIEVGSRIGALSTLLLLLISASAGCLMVRSRFRQIFQSAASLNVNNLSLLWLPLSGFLFLFPGFISDLMAFALLVPQVQEFIKKKVAPHLQPANSPEFDEAQNINPGRGGGRIIEGTFEVIEEPDSENSSDKKS
ncbi:MAG: FxsA family protein [Succinivibrio sp.]|nr:FxsA family protein [Succinivibrio sp.]